MDILLWIVFGLVVGIVAKFLMPGRQGGGFIVTASNNLTTHMSFSATSHGIAAGGGPANTNDTFRVYRGNLVWLRPALAESREDLVSVETVNRAAEQLFVTLSDSVLGLGPPGGAQPMAPILLILTPRP